MARKQHWSVQRARARLPEVIDRAKLDGPQEIWRNGRKAVVVLSGEDWERLRKTASALGMAEPVRTTAKGELCACLSRHLSS